MAKAKDFFDKLPTAKGSEGGVYFDPDHHYKVAVTKCIDKEGRSDDFFIVEARIIESDNEKQGEGFCASQVVKLSLDAAAGNVADFLRAAWTVYSRDEEHGLDLLDPNNDEDWTDMKGMYNVACGEDNLLVDTIVYLKTTGIVTNKGKGSPFTIHSWYTDRPSSWPETVEEAN